MNFSISTQQKDLKNLAHYNIRGYVAHALRMLNHKLSSMGLPRIHDGDFITFEIILRNYNVPLENYFPQLVEWHIIYDNMIRNTGFLAEARELASRCALLRNELPWRVSVQTRCFIYRTFILPGIMAKYLMQY